MESTSGHCTGQCERRAARELTRIRGSGARVCTICPRSVDEEPQNLPRVRAHTDVADSNSVAPAMPRCASTLCGGPGYPESAARRPAREGLPRFEADMSHKVPSSSSEPWPTPKTPSRSGSRRLATWGGQSRGRADAGCCRPSLRFSTRVRVTSWSQPAVAALRADAQRPPPSVLARSPTSISASRRRPPGDSRRRLGATTRFLGICRSLRRANAPASRPWPNRVETPRACRPTPVSELQARSGCR